MSIAFETTVFCDPQGEAAARAYVVAAPAEPLSDDELASLRLDGQIVGPTCRYSTTLQAKIPFKHRGLTRWGDRTALVAEATIPDPCYWTTELPFMYRAVGEVTGLTNGPSSVEQRFGLRFVGAMRNRITLNGRIWVPRGISITKVLDETPLETWRETGSSIVVDDPSDEICSRASEVGVSVVARINGSYPSSMCAVRRLVRHPSILICGLDAYGFADDGRDRDTSANVLLAQRQDYFKDIIPVASGAAAFILEATRREFEDCIKFAGSMSKFPVLIKRKIGSRSFTEARQECDLLQRDLAGKYDVAGYLV